MILTPRQTEVLQLIADGKTAAKIALTLGTAENTVKNHLVVIRLRLGASNSTQAVAIAIRTGIIR